MRQFTVLPVLVLALAGGPSLADQYSAELRGDFNAAERSSTIIGDFGGGLGYRSIAESDDQEFNLAGTWYFDGASSNSGPRSRTAFLGRASGLSFGLGILDGDSRITIDSGIPNPPVSPVAPSTSASSYEGLFVEASLRYVLPGSDWFGSLSLSRAELESGPESGGVETDGNAYALGVGRYLGERTALELVVVRNESSTTGAFIGDPERSENDVSLALTHIGDAGTRWQYGADLVLTSQAPGESHTGYDLDLSLYPNRDIAFGAGARGGLGPGGSSSTEYSLFGSWFPREHWQLRAGYEFVDSSDPAGFQVISVKSDEDRFSLGLSLRF